MGMSEPSRRARDGPVVDPLGSPLAPSSALPPLPRLCFVVESGTDVRLVDGLSRYFDVTVLARRIAGGVEVNHPPLAPVRLSVGPQSRFRFAFRVLRSLAAGQRRFDFVLVQGYSVAALAANLAGILARMPGAMLICSPIERYYMCRRGRCYPGKPFRRLELFGLRFLARLNAWCRRPYLVLSRHLEQVVRGHGARSPIRLLPLYGVDTDIFRPAAVPRNELRARLGLPPDGALLFFSSRIAPEKDTETLLDAVRLLRRAGRAVWVVNLSGGYEQFLGAAKVLGVADRVVAANAIRPNLDLCAYYQASDLCVQASREEGLGFSPLEALACGVPVVAASVGGLTENIVDGETGWTYPVGDATVLASRIAEVLENPEEGARRAMNGRALVCERYSSRRVFEQFVDFVQDQLEAQRRRRGSG